MTTTKTLKKLATANMVGCQTTPGSDVDGGEMKLYVYSYINTDKDVYVKIFDTRSEWMESGAFDDADGRLMGYIAIKTPALFCGTSEELNYRAYQAAKAAIVETPDFYIGNDFGTIFLSDDAQKRYLAEIEAE